MIRGLVLLGLLALTGCVLRNPSFDVGGDEPQAAPVWYTAPPAPAPPPRSSASSRRAPVCYYP